MSSKAAARKTSDLDMRRFLKWLTPNGLVELRRKRIAQRREVERQASFDPLCSKEHLETRRLAALFPDAGAADISLATDDFVSRDSWKLPFFEFATLAFLCRRRQPAKIFEIGTYLGSTTLALARNCSKEAVITTLDLTLEDQRRFGLPEYEAGKEFRRTPWERKIVQHYGDSRSFDFRPYRGSVDLVFIDANHTYEFVKSDTENALEMLAPGGIIVWDDYLWTEAAPECVGVTRCVNELSRRLPCFQLKGTRFAVHVNDGVKTPLEMELSPPTGAEP